MKFPHICGLPEPTIEALAGSLNAGRLSSGLSEDEVRTIVGQGWKPVFEELSAASAGGFSLSQMSVLVRAVYDARVHEVDADRLFELILTGPHMRGAEVTSTDSVFARMTSEVREELIMAGYTVYSGKTLFADLARRMEANPRLRVVFCLNIERKKNNTGSDDRIIAEFLDNFYQFNWEPKWPKAELYYYPAALSVSKDSKAVLHSKCIIADNAKALVTSANLTGRALQDNMEAGLLVRHPLIVSRLRQYFISAIDTGTLKRLI